MNAARRVSEEWAMVLLGLLLMVGCVALAVDAVVQNTSVMHVIAFDQHVSGLSLGAIFVAGAVVGLLFALGMALFTAGVGRARRRRRDRRAAARDAATTESLREENARLEQELAAQQNTDTATAAYPTEPAGRRTAGRHRVES